MAVSVTRSTAQSLSLKRVLYNRDYDRDRETASAYYGLYDRDYDRETASAGAPSPSQAPARPLHRARRPRAPVHKTRRRARSPRRGLCR